MNARKGRIMAEKVENIPKTHTQNKNFFQIFDILKPFSLLKNVRARRNLKCKFSFIFRNMARIEGKCNRGRWSLSNPRGNPLNPFEKFESLSKKLVTRIPVTQLTHDSLSSAAAFITERVRSPRSHTIWMFPFILTKKSSFSHKLC